MYTYITFKIIIKRSVFMSKTRLLAVISLCTLVSAIFVVFTTQELRGEENRSIWQKKGNIVKEPNVGQEPAQTEKPEVHKAAEPITEPVIETKTSGLDSQNQTDPDSIRIPAQYGSIIE